VIHLCVPMMRKLGVEEVGCDGDDVDSLTLVMMAGLPGSGKTSLALAIGRSLSWPVIDKDTLKSGLLAAGIEDGLAGATAYGLMFEIGDDLLVQQRVSVILDSPLPSPLGVEQATDLALRAGAQLRFILCLADRSVRNQRIADRVARRSQPVAISTKPGNGRDQYKHLPSNSLIVETSRAVDDLLPEILPFIRCGLETPR
jgi:predicted kinase